jgi:NAD(P)H-nitrite reductase large subunit
MDKEFLRQMENVDELIPHLPQKLDDETLICECFCVNVADIRQLCVSKVDLDLVESRLSLGQGCKSCLKSKDSWVDKIF